jgi:tetratricopeptide (TPR) repeat protein
VCRDYKIKCQIDRLMKDPAYNTMLGSAYISDRMAEFIFNFITRKEFSGAEIFGYYASPQDGGGASGRATLTAGYGDLSIDKFNAWLSFDYLDNKGMVATDRPFSRTAYLPGLGVDRTTGAYPAGREGRCVGGVGRVASWGQGRRAGRGIGRGEGGDRADPRGRVDERQRAPHVFRRESSREVQRGAGHVGVDVDAAREDDRVLIYFAGHGFMYQGKGYLAPYDFDLARVKQTGYPMDDLGAIMGGKIRAKSKILLTDACHSGAITPANTPGITPEDTENLNRTLANLNKSLFSLTASRARERSFESPDLQGGHGVFTYYVVGGMGGEADANHDGVVSADELAEYVHTQVREYTSGQQNPTSDQANYDPEMLLAYIPSNAKPAVAAAPKFGSLIFETNMDEVELFVDGVSKGVLAKGKGFSVPGLVPGEHTIKAVRQGYEPDGPRQEMVYPGQESTVSVKITIARRRNKAAMDLLDDGLKYYNKGSEPNYRKAVELMEKALAQEPSLSQAAFYLGLTYSALFDQEKAQLSYKKAIQIDPDYAQARANYGGMLLDIGAYDEAIRQFNTVLQRDPKHATALTLVAQAYRLKELYPQSIEAAHKAIQLEPKRAEPHMWLADSLRNSGNLPEARKEYDQYLKLSDFDSKLAGKINYYALGYLIGIGKKKRAAQRDVWSDLRNLAWFGICDCERQMQRYDLAIRSCQTSLTYDSKDPYAHYALGLSYMHQANNTGTVADLDPALRHFERTVEINPDLDESSKAKKNIATIKTFLSQSK